MIPHIIPAMDSISRIAPIIINILAKFNPIRNNIAKIIGISIIIPSISKIGAKAAKELVLEAAPVVINVNAIINIPREKIICNIPSKVTPKGLSILSGGVEENLLVSPQFGQNMAFCSTAEPHT